MDKKIQQLLKKHPELAWLCPMSATPLIFAMCLSLKGDKRKCQNKMLFHHSL